MAIRRVLPSTRVHWLAVAMTAFDVTRYQDPLTIQRVIHGAKTVAVVGL